ncbi:MAG: hypothetical protein J5526_05870 [Bacteroidales bacterium]|nr:hypothetical protein [Bacteroidales bacterium]
MKEKTDKILTLVLLGVSLITAVFAVIFALQSDSKHLMDGIRELGNNFSGMFDVAYWILVILLAIAICAIVVFLVKKLALRFKEEPGYLKKFLLLIAIIVVLLVVSFLLAKGGDVDLVKYDITEGTSKLIGAACIMVYIIVIGAALAILVTEIMPKSNKKK